MPPNGVIGNALADALAGVMLDSDRHVNGGYTKRILPQAWRSIEMRALPLLLLLGAATQSGSARHMLLTTSDELLILSP